MDKNIYKVLVPHDFSSVADCAVNHASKIAKSFNGEVYLLHVVSKAKHVDEAKAKLNTTAKAKTKIETHLIFSKNEIFKVFTLALSLAACTISNKLLEPLSLHHIYTCLH